METTAESLRVAQIARTLESCREELFSILDEMGTDDAKGRKAALAERLRDHQKRALLSLAFVGQYSAGKSTIISALTGRRDLKIDADIATDHTSAYDWQGLQVVDTPGLFTERKDHDQVTYEAINRADLLAFCITYSLFDQLTAENFRKLAYEHGYRGKLILVVNKLSCEAGDVEQRIVAYERSAAEALKPNDLNDFPHVFIDAKDYLEGIDEQDDYLVKESRFGTLIHTLNRFSLERGMLARAETPALMMLTELHEIERQIIPDGPGDAAYVELLDRLERKLRNIRERLRLDARRVCIEYTTKVGDEGSALARTLGTEDFEARSKTAEKNIVEASNLACDRLDRAISQYGEEVRLEVERILTSELADAVADRFNTDVRVSQPDVENAENIARIGVWRERVARLEQIGNELGVGVGRLAVNSGRAAAQTTGFFLRSSEVAGSSLHHGVYAAGKFFNYSFGPWQAVNIAKNVANVAKVLGPVMAAAGFVLEVHQAIKESKYEAAIAQGRGEIVGQFHAMARELETHVERTMREDVEPKLFGTIDSQIADARQARTASEALTNKLIANLHSLRGRLRGLLDAPQV